MRFAIALLALVALAVVTASSCSDDRRDTTVYGGDSDSDTDTDEGPTGPIPQDCSDCVGVGYDLENMACAFDICDENLVVSQEYVSPTSAPTASTYAAVNHFGNTDNDLAPKLNDSYALMASGPAEGISHTEWMGQNPGTDPFAADQYADAPTYDEMEWQLTLQAPSEAHGFGFKYVFFSEEYDDYISTTFNDKFYVFLEAGSTNGGEKSVINFTECREPDVYHDFICEDGMVGCEAGGKYCYIAINSALSECCWFPDQGTCTTCTENTSILGTGFECFDAAGPTCGTSDSNQYGSSTGWLQTTWPINPGETFNITFHVHDTGDGIFDSEMILDSFQFMYDSTVPSTTPVE
jgi:hypothetical protein